MRVKHHILLLAFDFAADEPAEKRWEQQLERGKVLEFSGDEE